MTTICQKLYPNLINDVSVDENVIVLNCAFDRIDKRLKGRSDEVLLNLALATRELSKSFTILYYAHSPSDEAMLPYLDQVGIPYELMKLYNVPPQEVLVAYSRVALAVGMRGHAQMIPFGCGTPIVSLISHDKVRWFLEDINCESWGIEMLAANFKDQLLCKISDVMTKQIKVRLRIEELQRKLLCITKKNVQNFNDVMANADQA
jgi:polysaccharide pyruvyl transferase WcaK-like protein